MSKQHTVNLCFLESLEQYSERDKQERCKRIDYYMQETTYNDKRTLHYTKTNKRKFQKWLKKKRKAYVKYFKKWSPWDSYYLYKPIKMIIQDMFEYYKNDVCVWGSPTEDTRKQTLAQALVLLEKAEFEEEYGDYKLSQQQFNDAFLYISKHMAEWWD